jgi:hypothetical protein
VETSAGGGIVHRVIHRLDTMANPIKTAYRYLLDREVGVLGGELEAIRVLLHDQDVKLAAFEERFERLLNRVSMRMARSAPVDLKDTQLIKSLQQKYAASPGGNSGDEWDRAFPNYDGSH